MKGAAAVALAVGLALPLAARADPARDAFVTANILSILYHELGHAMIDVFRLPIFGQEEDAADVASVLLIDAIHAPDEAEAIARDAALGFLAEARDLAAAGEGPAWWSMHGPDEQRFFHLVCLFYGADPGGRRAFARTHELPQARRETCEEEFWLASDSWGPVFEDLETAEGFALDFVGPAEGLLARVVAQEVAALNARFRWPQPMAVIVEPCDEANAFYLADPPEIIVCTEYAAHLRRLFAQID